MVLYFYFTLHYYIMNQRFDLFRYVSLLLFITPLEYVMFLEFLIFVLFQLIFFSAFFVFNQVQVSSTWGTMNLVLTVLAIVLANAYSTFIKYFIYQLSVQNGMQEYQLKSQKIQSIELLQLLMPKFITVHMKNFNVSENSLRNNAGEVTIMFCDICDFD